MPHKNKEEHKAYQKAYRKANKEKTKAYRKANKEKIAEQNKAHYQANKEKIKAYRKANKEKIAEQKKAHYQANKEKILEREKDRYQANKEKIKAYRKANKEKIMEQRKAHYQANKEKILKQRKGYLSQRRKKDPLFRLTCVYRTSCRRAFASIGQKKNNSSLKLLGLETWQKLAKHIEAQFYDHPETGEKMTYDNHGYYGWHIDHIIPLDSAKTEEDVIKLCHYTNLQPLWAEDNIKKSNKILDTE